MVMSDVDTQRRGVIMSKWINRRVPAPWGGLIMLASVLVWIITLAVAVINDH